MIIHIEIHNHVHSMDLRPGSDECMKSSKSFNPFNPSSENQGSPFRISGHFLEFAVQYKL